MIRDRFPVPRRDVTEILRTKLETASMFWEHKLMQTVRLDEAQKHLAELVSELPRAGEMMIVDASDHPIARLAPVTIATSLRGLISTSVGTVLVPFPTEEDDLLGEMLPDPT